MWYFWLSSLAEKAKREILPNDHQRTKDEPDSIFAAE